MQVGPLGDSFSEDALLQVHLPTGRAPQEQVGPVMVFSAGAAEQVQLRADCFPQEQVACWTGGLLVCVGVEVEGGDWKGWVERQLRRRGSRMLGIGCWKLGLDLLQTQVFSPLRQQVEAVMMSVGLVFERLAVFVVCVRRRCAR